MQECAKWVMVPKTNSVPLGGRRKKIEQLAERLPEDAWSKGLPAEDSGERCPWEWACLGLAADPKKGLGARIPAPEKAPNVFLVLTGSARGSALQRPRLIGRYLVYAVLHQGV